MLLMDGECAWYGFLFLVGLEEKVGDRRGRGGQGGKRVA